MTGLYLILSLCLMALSGFAIPGLDIKINVSVLNKDGEPVSNAQVYVSFSALVDENDPWKGKKDIDVSMVSDKNGKCSVSGKTLSTLSVGGQKGGCYSFVQKFRFNARDEAKGCWIPNERNAELVLREIKNPIPMYAWGMHMEKYPVTTNQWVGFDMLLADWMPPYGHGKNEDVRFQITQDLEGDGMKHPQRVLDILFCGEKNGVQALEDSDVSYESDYIFPYFAPKDGYTQKTLRLEKWRNQVEYKDVTNIGSTNCFFRIRSKVDEKGDFVEGLYGKIRGPIDFQGRSDRLNLRIVYYVNPKPNDLNMEFDPEKNLITKKDVLKSIVLP